MSLQESAPAGDDRQGNGRGKTTRQGDAGKASVMSMVTRFFGVTLGLVVTLFVNHHSFLSNTNLVPGDQGDSRLVIFTLEHWFRVFEGKEAFFQLNMFYPGKLALGYADGLFLFSLPYGLFRAIGLDYFSSYQVLFVFVTVIGYATCALLLRKALQLNWYFSVLASVLLTSLNSMHFQADIGKLTAYYFCPTLIYWLHAYGTINDKGSLRAWACLLAFSIGLGLLFFTSYYAAWFFLFTLLLVGLIGFVTSAATDSPNAVAKRIGDFARANRLQLTAALVVIGAALVPFLVTYAPLIVAHSDRSLGLVLEFTPTWRDIVNVSSANYVWSPLLNWLGFGYGNREIQMGSPLLVLVLFGAFYFVQILPRFRRVRLGEASGDRFIFILSTTAFVVFALTIKIHGVSAWYVVYRFVPGASALRALGRYLMVLDMIVIVTVVYCLQRWYQSTKSRGARRRSDLIGAAIAVLSCALVVEQANATPYRLNKAQQWAFIGAYDQPPPGCQSFFIINPTVTDRPVGYYQLDAMMISMNLGIPTINGYSGFAPNEVFTMVPSGIEYKYKMLRWLQLNDVNSGVCELDYQSRAFRQIDVTSDYVSYEALNRAYYLDTFSILVHAAQRFLQDKNELAKLYPQYLEEHGYLDPSYGYESGPSYKWIREKFWIGERACRKGPCFAVGVVGTYAEIQDIITEYGSQATQALFPYPEILVERAAISADAKGELLMVFPVTTPEN